MNITGMLFAGLLSLGAAGAQAQYAHAESEELIPSRLVGVFQNYDASGGLIRISNIEYSVSPKLVRSQLNRLRHLPTGRQLMFGVSGYDAKGRDVIVEIEAE